MEARYVSGEAIPQAQNVARLPLVHVAEGVGVTPALRQLLTALGVCLGPDDTAVHWRITVDVRRPDACATCAGSGEWSVMDVTGVWYSIPCPRCSEQAR
jgi:hypothetical protein